jgi:hypothetical protein
LIARISPGISIGRAEDASDSTRACGCGFGLRRDDIACGRECGSILKKGGSYMYLCTFPGHNSMMRGVLKFG